MSMFKNYTKIYLRRFRKETVHYLVNILGLGLGFSILFFILMYVYDEQNIDSYHDKHDRIYQVVSNVQEDDGMHNYLSTPGPLAEALKNEFPAVEETAHLTYMGSQVLVEGDKRIAERDWAIATSSLFKILDFDIVDGSPLKAFNGTAAMVITEDLAMRLFNRTDVVGEVIDDTNFGPTEVLAVIREMPGNSTYQFSNIYIANYDQWSEGWQRFVNSWDGRFAMTWVLLKEGAQPNEITDFQEKFLTKYLAEDHEIKSLQLQSIRDIHLQSNDIERGGMSPQLAIPYSDKEFVSMIMIMGLLVIFIAALNYINLSSVQALKRTLEASMRKINGANNKHLLVQLFFETLLTVLIAYAISLLLVVVLFPFFKEIANKEFSIGLLFTIDFVPYHLGSILIIWLVSAMLPALYYSKLKRSLLVLKNAFSGKGDLLRKGLVGVQYALSIFLIIGSIVIYRQLNYVQTKDLGFENNHLIVLDINSGSARRNFREIINGIQQHADVINASTSSRVPGEWKNLPTARLATNLTDNAIEASHYGIDHRWIDTYQMELSAGRNFSGNDQSDSLDIIINSEAAAMLDLDAPIGKSIWVMNEDDSVQMEIIGLIEDFHFESLYLPIGPVVLTSWNNHIRSIDYFTIRYKSNVQETIAHIEKVNATFDPETPAEINFLDEQWKRYYQAEESRATIILIASIVSIIISAFGLFGLINFTVERKTKEIGIRKVMGANIQNITTLILKDYLILLIISLLIAAPVSWWLFSDWLSDFAYRINLSVDLFVIAFVLVLIISFTTVLSRIYKIAKSNPVQSIRYE